MDASIAGYEKLGKFYLGRTYDLGARELDDELILYDSKDLVTHGVVLGMTGSGKTGLCIAMLEEAALDSIPAIVIDPKGDIPNIMLQFPELRGSDFRPWINEDDAAKKGITPDEFAEKQAELWKNGLDSWGQDGDRIRALSDKVDINVFTPGSSAGIPVSILSSLDAPDAAILDDAELLSERVESTVSSLLSLLGIDADPIQSPEHIVLSTIFVTCWKKGESLTLPSLIQYIQKPPFEKVGVLGLEDFYPEKKRFELAMKMNSLLASPGFSTWLKGVPLDINRMMHAPDGRPRISIFSIAHLSDSERMFFVSLLLNQMLGWMRTQSGTTSLRALLYMDEIYGYLPPTANPPSKKPMMTMLKQARAFGLGVLLATQNPVDLDYKALSNIGTWFLGRLQTERDKARVLDGLEGAAASQDSGFDRREMEELLAGLGSRVFLLNNVHKDAPLTFHVRWVLSYLCGPLARAQIKELMDPKRANFEAAHPKSPEKTEKIPPQPPAPEPPEISGHIDEFYVPVAPDFLDQELVYMPAILRSATVKFDDGQKEFTQLSRIWEDSESPDWSEAFSLPTGMNLSHLKGGPRNAKEFGALPAFAKDSTKYTVEKHAFADWLYENKTVEVWKSEVFDECSKPAETEGDFRGRLQHKAHELRDRAVLELQQKFDEKLDDLEDDLEDAQDVLREQSRQARNAMASSVVRIGTSILGALMSKRSRLLTATNVRTASSSGSRALKEGRDVSEAKAAIRKLEQEQEALEKELEKLIKDLDNKYNSETTPLKTEKLKPLKKDIDVQACGLAWLPFVSRGRMELQRAWE